MPSRIGKSNKNLCPHPRNWKTVAPGAQSEETTVELPLGKKDSVAREPSGPTHLEPSVPVDGKEVPRILAAGYIRGEMLAGISEFQPKAGLYFPYDSRIVTQELIF